MNRMMMREVGLAAGTQGPPPLIIIIRSASGRPRGSEGERKQRRSRVGGQGSTTRVHLNPSFPLRHRQARDAQSHELSGPSKRPSRRNTRHHRLLQRARRHDKMMSRPGPTRRQFQSCDACRQRRKACDAGYLGIVTSALHDQSANHASCTACKRKGTSCTFNWLLKNDKRTMAKQSAPSTTKTRRRRTSDHSHESTAEPNETHDADLTGYAAWTSSFTDRVPAVQLPMMGPADGLSSRSQQPRGCPESLFSASALPCSSSTSQYPLEHATEIISGFSDGLPDSHEEIGSFGQIPQTCAFDSSFQFGQYPLDPTFGLGLSARHERQSVSNSFLSIYRRGLEHFLTGWSSAESSPYVDSMQILGGLENAFLTTGDANFYDRVRRMDSSVSQLGLCGWQYLSPSQHAKASEALQTVILAYASQWNPSYSGADPAVHGNAPESLATSLHKIMQKSLWHQARLALDATDTFSCFKLVYARLIFSATSSPLDENDGMESRSLQDLKDCLRDLSKLRSRLETALKSTKAVDIPQATMRRAFMNEFGILYWLGIMCDTTHAAVTGQPLIISDEETAVSRSARDSLMAGAEPLEHETHRVASTNAPGERRVSLWDDGIVTHSQSLKALSSTWPLSEAQISCILSKATSLKVLLYRRVAALQALSSRRSSSQQIEGAIQNALLVYQQWETTYGGFMANCMQDWKSLTPAACSSQTILAGHWHYGALLLSDQITAVDANGLSDSHRNRIRSTSFLVAELSVTNARAIARLASRCLQWGSHPYGSNTRAMTADPWPMLTLRALLRASAVLGTAARGGSESYLANFVHHRRIAPSDIVLDMQSVANALRELGSRLPVAGRAATVLEQGLTAMPVPGHPLSDLRLMTVSV